MHNDVINIKVTKNGKNRLKAGVAGAGGGTVFILIAESLPESWTIKPILVYLAPTFSIISSAFWLWMLRIYNQYQRNRKFEFVIKQLQGYINNPAISKIHRAQLVKQMEEIQLSVLSKRMKEVEEMFNRETL